MKNTIKTIAALLIVLSTATSHASVDSTTVETYCKLVAQNEEDNFKLIYNSTLNKSIQVKWINSKNQTVYKETISKRNSFVKQYDLDLLPDGVYKVELNAGYYSFTEDVILGDLSEVKFTIWQMEDNSIVLSGVKPDSKQVRLIILDDDNNEIYAEGYDDKSIIQKKFNLEKVDSKEVTFALFCEGTFLKEETFLLE